MATAEENHVEMKDDIEGMGDDEELEIGGKVAGMTQGPVKETTTQQTVTNTVKQDVVQVAPSMQMQMNPELENYG